MGMPEFVSSPIPTAQRPRLVALIAPGSVLTFRSEPELLGIQYVAALFPVSRLSLAHGSQLFLLETASEVLQLAGYDPVIISEASLPVAARTLHFQHILKPQLKELAVNAYDALFFRILRISGTLVVEELSGDAIDLRRSTAIAIGETQYKTDGHAPTLSALLKRTVAETFKRSLRDLASPIRKNPPGADAEEQSPLIAINLLAGAEALRPVASLIEASYGFPGALGYNERSMARLIQRGMQATLEDRTISSVSTTLGTLPSFSPLRPVWSLTGAIDEISVHEQLTLGLTLKLDEIRPGGATSVVMRAHCRGSFEELDNLDGSWAFTLEQAAGTLVESFLEEGTACSVIS